MAHFTITLPLSGITLPRMMVGACMPGACTSCKPLPQFTQTGAWGTQEPGIFAGVLVVFKPTNFTSGCTIDEW